MSVWTWITDRFGHRKERASLGARLGEPWHRYGWTEPTGQSRVTDDKLVPLGVIVSDHEAWLAGERLTAPTRDALDRQLADAARRFAQRRHAQQEAETRRLLTVAQQEEARRRLEREETAPPSRGDVPL